MTIDPSGDGDFDQEDAWIVWAMANDPAYAFAVATGGGTNTIHVCTWCEGALATMQADRTLEKKMTEGKKGADIKELHEHLKRFGFTLDLQSTKSKAPKDSVDLEKDTWGKYTQRAVKLFASHPQVGTEVAGVSTSDGKKLTSAIADKIREWCRTSTTSPQNYWEFPSLKLAGGELDALGADEKGTVEKQTTLHHYIKQIQDDLAKTGFGVHKDAICEIDKAHDPSGEYRVVAHDKDDKRLSDTKHLVRRFQRQAAWLWRMKTDGSHLPDVTTTDASYHAGAAEGEMDAATARVLHHWAEHDLHMVIKKFELKNLDWPPGSGTPITIDSSSTAAKLRKDAYDAWYAAAKEIHDAGGTLAGPYSSSPRRWSGGKMSSAGSGNSAFSWHYSALAVDIGQQFVGSDGGISAKHRHALEEDGRKFRLWCWVEPQPAAPADPADDKKEPLKQYRNRNIKKKHKKGSAASAKVDDTKPTDAAPLYAVTTTTSSAGDNKEQVAVKEGWYLDLSAILEKHGVKRIVRHSNWVTFPKGMEWWHYQYEPAKPSPSAASLGFGDYLQLYGVHEYRLRNTGDGWSTHDDIDHAPG